MSEIVKIPDNNFRNCILKQLGRPSDYEITKDDCESVIKFDCSSLGIKSLEGIEYFINLKCLDCQCNPLVGLELSKNIKLTHLYCANNQLISLDLSNNIELKHLYCKYNQLTCLDLSKNIVLANLFCYNNKLTSLDVSKNVELYKLYCSYNQLTSLDLSKNSLIMSDGVSFHKNQLTNIKLNDNIELIANYTAIISNFNILTIKI